MPARIARDLFAHKPARRPTPLPWGPDGLRPGEWRERFDRGPWRVNLTLHETRQCIGTAIRGEDDGQPGWPSVDSCMRVGTLVEVRAWVEGLGT